jgi:hypothetical protein
MVGYSLLFLVLAAPSTYTRSALIFEGMQTIVNMKLMMYRKLPSFFFFGFEYKHTQLVRFQEWPKLKKNQKYVCVRNNFLLKSKVCYKIDL